VATELISLIADHPLRDDQYALRMRAPYHAVRAAEALAVYAAAREGHGGRDRHGSVTALSSDRAEVNPSAARHVYEMSDRLWREAAKR